MNTSFLSASILAFSTLVMSTVATANDYIIFKGQKIELGRSLHYVTKKLGSYDDVFDETKIWESSNDNRLSISFDQYGANDIHLSGKGTTNYVMAEGTKITFNDSINSIMKKFPYGCLYEDWNEGVIASYVVPSGAEASANLIFSAWSHGESFAQAKAQKIDTISLTYEEPTGTEQHCSSP